MVYVITSAQTIVESATVQNLINNCWALKRNALPNAFASAENTNFSRILPEIIPTFSPAKLTFRLFLQPKTAKIDATTTCNSSRTVDDSSFHILKPKLNLKRRESTNCYHLPERSLRITEAWHSEFVESHKRALMISERHLVENIAF